MKRFLGGLIILGVLLVGSMAVLADPWAEPGTGNSITPSYGILITGK